MKKLFSGCFTVLLSVLFVSCGKEELPPPPETESVTLNQLLHNAPYSRVNLHQISTDTLILPAGQIVDRFPLGGETRNFNRPDQVLMYGDNLVVMEYANPEIFVLNREGEAIRKLQSGERFQRPTAIMSDGKDLYVYDDGEKVLVRFDSELEQLDSIPLSNPYFTAGSVDMNRSYIIYQPDEATGFRVSETDRKLLAILRNDQRDSIHDELMPRIVPSGKQPGGYNNITFSMNNENTIVAAYPSLPYLFIFNKFEQSHTVILDEETFAEIDNPSLSPFQPVMGEAIRINTLIEFLHITDRGEILLFSQGELYRLKTERDGTYKLHSRTVLVRGDTGDIVRSLTSISRTPDETNGFYATGDGLLFGLILPN